MIRKYVEIIKDKYKQVENKTITRILVFPFRLVLFLLKIINKSIQWSKKCYFFHFFFIQIGWLYLLAIMYTIATSNPLELHFEDYFIVNILVLLHIFCALLYAIPLTLIAMLIKFIFKREITVSSNFLLNNKFYNIYYIFCLLFFVLSIIQIIYTCHCDSLR